MSSKAASSKGSAPKPCSRKSKKLTIPFARPEPLPRVALPGVVLTSGLAMTVACSVIAGVEGVEVMGMIVGTCVADATGVGAAVGLSVRAGPEGCLAGGGRLRGGGDRLRGAGGERTLLGGGERLLGDDGFFLLEGGAFLLGLANRRLLKLLPSVLLCLPSLNTSLAAFATPEVSLSAPVCCACSSTWCMCGPCLM